VPSSLLKRVACFIPAAALVMTAVAVSTPAVAATTAQPDCGHIAERLQAAGFSPGVRQTVGGVDEVVYSGKIPSWDGVPLDADLALPVKGACGAPVITFGHGWGNSKTDWESSTVDPAGNRNHWNALWFVSKGYAALTFSNRGWHGSCGPDASTNGLPSGLPAECTENGRQYWIHLSDLRYEIRDAQWLIGRVIDAGVGDPQRLAVTGGSLGGGFAWLMALANDRTMCGGQGWDAANGVDPCAGQQNGQLIPWRSPAGRPLHVRAAVPEYTWASLVNALLPNGRASITAPAGTTPTSLRDPIGIPIQSYVTGLYADGEPLHNGFYQPPTSTDTTADLTKWFAAVSAGPNSVTMADPQYAAEVNQALDQLQNFKSPLSPLLQPDALVPVMQIQGFTDPLFKPIEAELIRQKVKAFDPAYPITTVYGDVGHSYASNPADVWARFNEAANRFLDYELNGIGAAPPNDVEASLTRCATGGAVTSFTAPAFAQLATSNAIYRASGPAITTSAAEGPEAEQTDPIANSGCRTMSATTDPGVAAWSFPVAPSAASQTLLGAPKAEVDATPTGPDSEILARLWDVDTVAGTQTLVARGATRLVATPGNPQHVSVELSANGWTLRAGHQWKLEITGADAPTYQLDSIPSTLAISDVSLTLPIR
jgi:dienelactone hydrolase